LSAWKKRAKLVARVTIKGNSVKSSYTSELQTQGKLKEHLREQLNYSLSCCTVSVLRISCASFSMCKSSSETCSQLSKREKVVILFINCRVFLSASITHCYPQRAKTQPKNVFLEFRCVPTFEHSPSFQPEKKIDSTEQSVHVMY
jgi:hypothetical protein